MDITDFKILLFEVACCAVACDHNIDEREIRELQYIDKSTVYFEDIDLSKQLDSFLANFNGNETEIIDELEKKISNASLSPVEELLVMEITLRLIYADTKIDEKEIGFLKSVRMALSLTDKMIRDRFGAIDILKKEPEISTSTDGKATKPVDYGTANINNLGNLYSDIDDKKQK